MRFVVVRSLKGISGLIGMILMFERCKVWVDKWQLELLLLLIIIVMISIAALANIIGVSLFQPFGPDNYNCTL